MLIFDSVIEQLFNALLPFKYLNHAETQNLDPQLPESCDRYGDASGPANDGRDYPSRVREIKCSL